MATPPNATGSKPVVTLPEVPELPAVGTIKAFDFDKDGKINQLGANKSNYPIDDAVIKTQFCMKMPGSGDTVCEDDYKVFADYTATAQDFSLKGSGLWDPRGGVTKASQIIGRDAGTIKDYIAALEKYQANPSTERAFAVLGCADRAGFRTAEAMTGQVHAQARSHALTLLNQLVNDMSGKKLEVYGADQFDRAARMLALTGGDIQIKNGDRVLSSLTEVRDCIIGKLGGTNVRESSYFRTVADRAIQGSQIPPRATAVDE